MFVLIWIIILVIICVLVIELTNSMQCLAMANLRN